MKANKPFKTIEQQIEILKRRNLLFHDKEASVRILRRYGYYESLTAIKKILWLILLMMS